MQGVRRRSARERYVYLKGEWQPVSDATISAVVERTADEAVRDAVAISNDIVDMLRIRDGRATMVTARARPTSRSRTAPRHRTRAARGSKPTACRAAQDAQAAHRVDPEPQPFSRPSPTKRRSRNAIRKDPPPRRVRSESKLDHASLDEVVEVRRAARRARSIPPPCMRCGRRPARTTSTRTP